MLVLTRRVGESIQIGDDITLVVLGVENGRAKLGVAAPKKVPVLRTELTRHPTPGPDPNKGDTTVVAAKDAA